MKRKPFFAPNAEVWILSEGKPVISPLVQILRTGEFSHPDYGSFSITKDYLLSLVTNFKNKVRKIDLAVDYKHANEDVAAGWFQDLQLSEDGEKLLAKIDWTPTAQKVLSDKEFRYLSAEFADEYKDSETGNNYGPTLLGAGLTNRPFVKGMEPVVQLSEKPKNKEGVNTMTEAEKKEFEDLKAANKKLQEEKDAEAKKLSEASKKLDEQKAKDEQAAKDAKVAEKKAAFDKKLAEGSVCEAQREAFMLGDTDKFLELAQPVKTKTLSENGENGGDGKDKDKGDENAEAKIIELAEKIEKEQKLDRGRAISKVLADPKNKALRESYEKQSSVR